jgi:hypothetical protein
MITVSVVIFVNIQVIEKSKHNLSLTRKHGKSRYHEGQQATYQSADHNNAKEEFCSFHIQGIDCCLSKVTAI